MMRRWNEGKRFPPWHGSGRVPDNQMSPEGILLQMAAGKLGLNTQAIPSVTRNLVGKALGVELNGLSLENERQAILDGLKAKGLTLE